MQKSLGSTASVPPRLRSTSPRHVNKSSRVAHFRNYLCGPLFTANNWMWRRSFSMVTILPGPDANAMKNERGKIRTAGRLPNSNRYQVAVRFVSAAFLSCQFQFRRVHNWHEHETDLNIPVLKTFEIWLNRLSCHLRSAISVLTVEQNEAWMMIWQLCRSLISSGKLRLWSHLYWCFPLKNWSRVV